MKKCFSLILAALLCLGAARFLPQVKAQRLTIDPLTAQISESDEDYSIMLLDGKFPDGAGDIDSPKYSSMFSFISCAFLLSCIEQ